MKPVKTNPSGKRLSFFLAISLITLLFSAHTHSEPMLNGIASHSELGKEQFIGGLYSSTLTNESKQLLLADEEKRIEVRVLAERFSSRRFKRMWIEGMAINASSVELAKQSNNMAAFSNMLKIKLIKGDVFAIDRNYDDVTVSLNGVKLGVIDDPSFFDLLLRTWIGPVPLSSDFRSALMVSGDTDDELLGRFQAIGATEERIAAIQEGTQALKASPAQVAVAAPDIAPPAPIVAAPKAISAPQIAAPEVKVETPAKPEEKPEETKPVVEAPKPVSTPKPAPVVAKAEPKPAPPKPKPVKEESIFDEEDDEEFTAAGLLEQQLYIATLKRVYQKKLRYPQTSLNKGQEGNIRLEITINRSGKVQSVETLEESDYKLLNREAKAAVKRTKFPKMPELIKGEDFTFTIPVAFKLVSKK